MKKLLLILVSAALILSAAFASAAEDPPKATVSILKDESLGQIFLNISIDDFNAFGFRYGDSCDVLFSNGVSLKDIPYYNGYYAKTGDPLIVAYPGYAYVAVAICNADPSWDYYGCREGDSAAVVRAEAGRYLQVQDALDLVYSNDRADYPDDERFANFRAMKGGRLREDTFYRGASPVNNMFGRAGYVDELIRKAGVRFVLDLADTDEKVRQYAEESRPAYFLSLYESGRVAPLGLTAASRTETFRASLADGLREMMKYEGPYYIHCLEGKDRTGFVCMLLEALSGAGTDEITEDYMETYKSYYGIVPGTAHYQAVLDVKFHDFFDWITGLGDGTPESGAAAYLEQSGMSETEIRELQSFLTGE